MNKLLSILLLVVSLTACGKGDSINASVSAKDGQPCTLTNNTNHSTITCGNLSTEIPQGTTIIGYIYPCSKLEFNNDEIFLRFSDGNVLMVFDGGNYLSRLAFAVPGMTYVTTDRTGSQCYVHFDNCLNVSTTPKVSEGAVTNPTGCNIP